MVFKEPSDNCGLPAAGNNLSLELSGEGEIDLSLVAKVPGPTLQLAPASAPIPLGTAYHTQSLPAYSRLIHDVLVGDRSLFTRPDGLAHVWKVASAVLENKPEPVVYPRVMGAQGSGRPDSSGSVAARWLTGCQLTRCDQSSSDRSLTTRSAPWAASASAWPTRSTPTT